MNLIVEPSKLNGVLDKLIEPLNDQYIKMLLRQPDPKTGRIFIKEAFMEVCKKDANGNYVLVTSEHKNIVAKASEKLFYFAMEELSNRDLVDIGVTEDGEFCFRLNKKGEKEFFRDS